MSCALYIVLQVTALGLAHVSQLVAEACYVMRTVHCAASYRFMTGKCPTACGWGQAMACTLYILLQFTALGQAHVLQLVVGACYGMHIVQCAASYYFGSCKCPTACVWGKLYHAHCTLCCRLHLLD